MAGNQLDNLQVLENGLHRSLESTDNIQISGSFEVQSDVLISGNLTVEGTHTSVESETVRIADNHLFLNDGYTTAVAQSGGLVVNYLPTATVDTVAATGFVAGVPATSDPLVNTTAAAAFAANDFILISGAADDQNNGLYEVLTSAGNVLTIRGIGLNATIEDFTENQFVTDTTVQGDITHINISIMRAGTDGAWETASGNNHAGTGLTFTDLGTGGGNSLNAAYVVGNTITTSAGEGDVIIAGTEELQVTTTGGINLDSVFDADVSTFDVQMTGTNGFSIDGTAASNVTVTAGNLTLSTATSGDVIVSSVANVTVDGTGISIDGTAASNLTVTGANLTISTVTTGDVIVSSVANVTVDGTGISIDGTAASNVSTTSANLTLSTITAGTLFVTSAGLLDIDAAANIDIDVTGSFDVLATTTFSIDGTGASNVTATSGNLTLATLTTGNVLVTAIDDVLIDGVTVSIDGTEDSNLTITANDAAVQTLTISATNAGAGDADIAINAENTLTADAADFSIDGTAASNVSVTGAQLQISTITSGELDLTSAGLLDINAAANIDIDVTGSFDVLATTTFSIDGTGASNVTATSGNLTLSTLTTGDVIVSSIANVTVDGTGISIDGTAASNLSTTGANLTLSTITSGTLAVTSAADVDINATTGVTIDGTTISIDGTAASNVTVTGANLTLSTLTTGDVVVSSIANVTVDGTGISIDGTAASNVTVTGGNLTLSTVTTGGVLIDSVGDSTYTVPNGSATAFALTDGTVTYITVDSTDDAIDIDQHINIIEGAGYDRTTQASLVAGNLVSSDSGGDLVLADANTASIREGLVVGVSRGTFASPPETAQILSVPGTIVPVLFTAAPAATDNGRFAYLSNTAGQATNTAPSGNDVVTFIVGVIVGADGALTTVDVALMPQFVSKGPTVTDP